MVGIRQFRRRRAAQFAVLRQTLLDQAGQQVALFLQHAPALIKEADLPANLQQGALGGWERESSAHGIELAPVH